jgi:hypothetical protein
MDKDRGRSTGPSLGPEKGKDKRSHPGPQAKAENDEDHQAPQRDARHEEDASRDRSCVDAEEGPTRSNGTSPRDSIKGHCASRGGKEEHGINIGKVRANDHGGDHSESVICTQRKDHAGSNTRKGTHKQVPHSSRSC